MLPGVPQPGYAGGAPIPEPVQACSQGGLDPHHEKGRALVQADGQPDADFPQGQVHQGPKTLGFGLVKIHPQVAALGQLHGHRGPPQVFVPVDVGDQRLHVIQVFPALDDAVQFLGL